MRAGWPAVALWLCLAHGARAQADETGAGTATGPGTTAGTATATGTATETKTGTGFEDALTPPSPILAPPAGKGASPGNVNPWGEGEPRFFVSGAFDVGFLYLRPRFSVGYGEPFHRWVGVDANPVLSEAGIAFYVGLRGALPSIDLRVGARGRYTFSRSYLCPTVDFDAPDACAGGEPLPFYDREDLNSTVGRRSTYISWEAELSFSPQLGPGNLIGELAATAVTEVDDDFFVYEETLRVVVNPPWVLRGRLGYLWPLDRAGAIRVGMVAEGLYVPGRDMWVMRGGVLGRVWLWSDLEARATFIPALVTRDTLGAAGGDTFLLGIRYRFATR